MFETWPRWDSVRLKDLRCCPCLDWPLKIKIWLAGTRKWPAETETWQNRWRRVSCYILLFSWHKDFKATYIWDVCSSHRLFSVELSVVWRRERQDELLLRKRFCCILVPSPGTLFSSDTAASSWFDLTCRSGANQKSFEMITKIKDRGWTKCLKKE